MKLRTIGMAAVAALALVAGRVEAQDAAAAPAPAAGGGWDTKYGILFTIPNLFQNNSSTVIDQYGGKVGFQYNMAPQSALRLSLSFLRGSAGIVTTDDNLTGVTTETLPPVTSSYDVKLGAEYLMRMTTADVSPYGGVGAQISFVQSKQKGEITNPGLIQEYDNLLNRDIGLGVVGKLGLEWRVHKVIALFAEYDATLTLASFNSSKSFQKNNGTVVSDSETSSKNFLGLSTGVSQSGQLGIIAFF